MPFISPPADLATALTDHPRTIAVQAPLAEAIEVIHEHGYILALSNHQLRGIVTKHDLIKPWAAGHQLNDLSIADVMTAPVVTLPAVEFTNVSTALNLLQTHQIKYLPLVDDRQAVVGLLRYDQLLQCAHLPQLQRRIKSLEQQVAILEASTDYIGMADTKGHVIWTNTKGRQIHGLQDLNVAVSLRYFAACYPPWALKIIREVGLPTAIDAGSWFGETALLDAEGQEIPTAQMILAHKSPQGEVELFSTILRDIRSIKEYERRLERSNAELTQATRLKDEFLATMSHELRTPLNAILGMSESLLEQIYGSLNHRQQQSIDTINRNGHHLLTMINDILEVSNLAAGQLELELKTVEIAQLCKSSLAGIRQSALHKRIQITANIATNLAGMTMAVDERRLQQVLSNLLGNAIKFTPDHGQITLAAYLDQTQQLLCCSITDTGIGIAAAHLSQIFQPFCQIDSDLNRQYAGTGLGLALVKQIVELHGGQINVSSELGQGSCFAVQLPLLEFSHHDPKPLHPSDNASDS
jgi:signal transduction histidine kinase